MMASTRLLVMASTSVSNRRIWTVQEILISWQSARARSPLKPAGLPSAPGKLNGGEEVSVRNRITVRRDMSGRSGRRRGSQKPGTACGAASAAGLGAGCAGDTPPGKVNAATTASPASKPRTMLDNLASGYKAVGIAGNLLGNW